MIKKVIDILSLKDFEIHLEDPTIPLPLKLKGRPFITVSLTNRQIKFARAIFRGKALRIESAYTGTHDDLLTAEINEAFYQQLLNIAGPHKTLVIGMNMQFAPEKFYAKGTKLRDIERLIKTSIKAEVQQFDASQTYLPFPVRNQYFLAGVDQERVDKVYDRFKTLGFKVAAIYNQPAAIIAEMGRAPLDWEASGIAVYFHQNVYTMLGWSNNEVVLVRSRALGQNISSSKKATGVAIALQSVATDLLREIETQTKLLATKIGHDVQHLYIHGERTDNTLAAIQDRHRLPPKPIPWTTLSKYVEFPDNPPPHPDLGVIT
jgi:hypothetical protein